MSEADEKRETGTPAEATPADAAPAPAEAPPEAPEVTEVPAAAATDTGGATPPAGEPAAQSKAQAKGPRARPQGASPGPGPGLPRRSRRRGHHREGDQGRIRGARRTRPRLLSALADRPAPRGRARAAGRQDLRVQDHAVATRWRRRRPVAPSDARSGPRGGGEGRARDAARGSPDAGPCRQHCCVRCLRRSGCGCAGPGACLRAVAQPRALRR